MRGPDGSAVPLRESDVTYESGSRKGVAVGTFDAERPGTYVVQAQVGGGRLAVGKSVPDGFLYGFGTTLFVGLGLVLASLVLTVVVAVRRRRFLRAQAGWAPLPDDPEQGRRRLIVGAGVGVVAAVVVGAALASVSGDGNDVETYLEPTGADWSSTTTTHLDCTEHLNADLDMCARRPRSCGR